MIQLPLPVSSFIIYQTHGSILCSLSIRKHTIQLQEIIVPNLSCFDIFCFFILQPQHGLPDVFVWMISGGKRIAYGRIPAANVLYSPRELEKGLNCGRVQTVFLKVIRQNMELLL